MCHVNNWNSFYFYYFRVVTGPPEDDPKGRWRRGGGKNVPVKVTLKLEEKQSSLSVARVNVQDVCSWPACVYSGSMTVSADKNNFLN